MCSFIPIGEWHFRTRRKKRIAGACTRYDSAVFLIKYGVGPVVSIDWLISNEPAQIALHLGVGTSIKMVACTTWKYFGTALPSESYPEHASAICSFLRVGLLAREQLFISSKHCIDTWTKNKFVWIKINFYLEKIVLKGIFRIIHRKSTNEGDRSTARHKRIFVKYHLYFPYMISSKKPYCIPIS